LTEIINQLGPVHFVWITGVLVIASIVQASAGFGFGIIAAPILLLLADWLVPGPLIFSAIVLTVMSSIRERYDINFAGLVWLLMGRFPGTLLGLGALLFFTREKLAVVIGVIILIAVALSFMRGKFEPSRKTLIGAGVASGFMATISSVGGPPVALIYQHSRASELRATMAVYFTIGGTVSLTGLHFIGLFGAHEIMAGLSLVPGVVLGFILSRWSIPKIDQESIRTFILSIATAAGVAILFKYW